MAEPRSLSLDDLDWEQVDPDLKKKVIDGQQMTLTRYSFGPGGRFPHHVHDQEQMTIVLRGGITFRIEGVPHELRAGSVVVIPSDVPHSAEAGEGGAEVLSVVSPPRTGGRGISMLEEGN